MMMKRREFIALCGAAVAWPFATRAQQPKVPRIGILLVGNREPFWTAFREGLRELGYIEGRNILLDGRSSEGKPNLLPDLVSQLIHANVDIIVASETPAVQAAKRATSEIPIVMAPSGDPVGTGLIASLARPGGNGLAMRSLAQSETPCTWRPSDRPMKATAERWACTRVRSRTAA